MAEQSTAAPPPPAQSRDERGVSFGPNVAEPRTRATKVDRQGSTDVLPVGTGTGLEESALNLLGFGNGMGQLTVKASFLTDPNRRGTCRGPRRIGPGAV